jgi:hypothetical protein
VAIYKGIIVLIACCLFLIGSVSLISLLGNPESYRFGTEVAGFTYRSELHYWLMNLVIVILSLFSTLLAFKKRIYIATIFLIVGISCLAI